MGLDQYLTLVKHFVYGGRDGEPRSLTASHSQKCAWRCWTGASTSGCTSSSVNSTKHQ